MSYIFILMGFVTLTVVLPILFPNVKDNFGARLLFVVIVILYLILIYNRPLFFMDTRVYIERYNLLTAANLNGFNILSVDPVSQFEYGFVAVALLFKSLGLSFRLMSTVITGFNIIVFHYFIITFSYYLTPMKKNYYYTWYLTLGLNLFYFGTFYNLIAIRGWLSMGLVMLSLIFTVRNKTTLMIISFCLAILIQRGALISTIPIMLVMITKGKRQKVTNSGSNNLFTFMFLLLGFLMLIAFIFQSIFFESIWKFVSNLVKNFYQLPSLDQGNQNINRLIMLFGYWLTGLPFIYIKPNYQRSQPFILSYYLMMTVAIALVGYYNSNRFIDYLFLMTLPLSYYCIRYSEHRNQIWYKILIIIPQFCFILGLTLEYINWYHIWS